jgi:HlyD family secretion protein
MTESDRNLTLMDVWNRYGKRLSLGAAALVVLLLGLKLTVLAPYQVKSTTLTPHDVQQEAFGVGTVETKVTVSVGSKITNRITRLMVDQGDRVRKGQLLATLENEDFHAQVTQAERDLARAGHDLVANQAAIRQAEANLALAQKNYERYRALFRENFIAEIDLDQKKNEFIVSQEAINVLSAQRKSLEEQQQRAQAAVGFAKANLAYTQVYAPCDGVVVSRDAEEGDAVVAGVPLFRIADTSCVWARAYIDETVAGPIRLGQPARVILRSQPTQSYPGHVARVEVASDRVTEERVIDVKFTVPSDAPPIGEQVEVHIVTAQKLRAPALPRHALVPSGKSYGVWLIQDSRAHWREVQIGISDPSGWIEIVSGVEKTDRVAVASPEILTRLSENARVTVTEGTP